MSKKIRMSIQACLEDGNIDLIFSCQRIPEKCRYALSQEMPIQPGADCHWLEYGQCLCPLARVDRLRALASRLVKAANDIEDEE